MTDAPFPPPLTPKPASNARSMARSVIALVMREMATRYGRTPGGYVWAVVEPAAAIVVLAFMFSLVMRTPRLGNSFLLYYASGYLPFILMMNISSSVQGALNFSKPLLMYPAVSWIDALFARLLLNFLTTFLIGLVILFGILNFTPASASLDFPPLIVAVALATGIGFGLGVFNCVAAGLFPVYAQFWAIATRPMVIIAGVIILYDQMPPLAQKFVIIFPFIHVTGHFRTGIYSTYDPEYISIPFVIGWSLLPMVFGLLFLKRYYQIILMR